MRLIGRAKFTGHRFVLMCGDYVAICWNGAFKTDTRVIDGRRYTAQVAEPKGAPYLDFVSLRENNGEVWEDEDDSVSGGITPGVARQVAEELTRAVALLEEGQ